MSSDIPLAGDEPSIKAEYERPYRIAKVIGVGALVIGSLAIMDELVPGDEPSVAHNLVVKACADELDYTESVFTRNSIPAACVRFSDDYADMANENTISITLPPRDVFVEQNTAGMEYDQNVHEGNRNRALGWFSIAAAALLTASALRRRRGYN